MTHPEKRLKVDVKSAPRANLTTDARINPDF